MEALEDRTLLSPTLIGNYNGLGFTSSGGTSAPPDSSGAAGTTNYVEAVNQAISIYTPKATGSTAVTSSLSNFFFTQGRLPHVVANDDQTDSFVIWDEQVQRFIVGDLDFDKANTNGDGNALLLAVSKSASPATLTTADWFFYAVPTTETGVAFQDYPGNPGYTHDALVVTLNSFNSAGAGLHSQVNAISINALINGTPLTAGTNRFQTDFSEFLLRPATMHDSTAGGPMWFVAEKGDNTSIDVIRMDNVLSSSPTFTTTNLAVNPYSREVGPKQPNGTVIDSVPDSRILKAAEQNGTLVAAHNVSNAAGNLDNARWYAIDISGGTPVLQQQGDISGGPGVYITFPGIDINAQGQIGMTYMQSGTAPGQFLSVFVTGHTAADAPGTMETPVLVQAGAGNYVQGFGRFRTGDFSGINVDTDGSFWIANEFANTDATANWGTTIAHFTLAPPVQVLPFNAMEGQLLINIPVASFIDRSGAPLANYTVTVSWGDGVTSAGRVSPAGNNTFTVFADHTYLEEGDETVTVTVKNGSLTIGSASGVIHVADAPLIAGASQILSSVVGSGISSTLVANFTDTDPTNTLADPQGIASDYTATIIWDEGGGRTNTVNGLVVSVGANNFAVFANNPFTYAFGGTFGATVIVRDVGGASVTINDVVQVADNPAIPPRIPIYVADASPKAPQFLTLQDATTNLLAAEMIVFNSMFSPPALQLQAFGNFMNAFVLYEQAVFRYDMNLLIFG